MANAQKETDPAKYPGFLGIGYPEVFTTIPQQPTEKKPGQLPFEKVQEYFEQGFTVVENFFTLEEIEPCREAYRRLVDDIAKKLYKSGRIQNLYEEYGLENRLLMLEKEWPGAVMLLLKLGKLTPEFRSMYQNEKLLNALEQLLGPNIGANPVWNTRPKTPGHRETHVQWHQDAAYFDLDAYKTMIVTAWIAFVDITEENGCLEFVKGGHKKGLVAVHTVADNFYLVLDEKELTNRLGADPEKDFVKCPVKAGGVVFFSNLTPHRSVPNRSDHIRWAMDLRYQSSKCPWGFYGMKSGIVLRSPEQPNIKPDWDFYDSQNRYDILKEYEIKKVGHGEIDEFDTTITGPHMEMWKITERNVHTNQFLDEKAAKNGKN